MADNLNQQEIKKIRIIISEWSEMERLLMTLTCVTQAQADLMIDKKVVTQDEMITAVQDLMTQKFNVQPHWEEIKAEAQEAVSAYIR